MDQLRPARALLHPVWVGSVFLLALNDHVLKGAGVLPPWVTGKLSDFAGLFAAPVLLAVLLRVRSGRGIVLSHVAAGLVFSAIKVHPAASHTFEAALGACGLTWHNTVDPTDLLALTSLAASLWLLVPIMSKESSPGIGRSLLHWAAAACALPLMLGSGNVGGANSGGHAPGSGDDGVYVGLGEIAVSPGGRYFLSRKGDELVAGRLEDRSVEVIRGLPAAAVLAFWSRAEGEGFFVHGLQDGRDTIASYDLDSRIIRWSRSTEVNAAHLKVNEKDGSLVLWDEVSLTVIDAATGEPRGSFAPPQSIRDVDMRDVQGQLIVTTDTLWETVGTDSLPRTMVYVRNVEDASPICEVKASNCADELVMARGGTRAFLAPTFCAKDPVTVLDLETCTVKKQLPGFGPVALSYVGNTAVAFIDRDANDPTAPPLPPEVIASSSRFHLMFIDVTSLEIGTLEVGEELPRYAVTPDGNMLLVDAYMSENNVRILDLEARTLRAVTGAYVLLDNYVMMPDSKHVYGIQQGLFEIDVPKATARTIGLTFTPSGINMTPSGETLLLRDKDELVHLFDVATLTTMGTMGR